MDGKELEAAPLLAATGRQSNVEKGFTLRRAMILPVLVLYFVSTGISLLVVPEYIQSHVASEDTKHLGIYLSSENHSRINQCENVSSSNSSGNTHIQQETAKWSMYFSIATSVPALFANVFYGTYSDVKGRKFMLCLCTLGMTLKFAIITVVVQYSADFIYILIGGIIEGCTGSFIASFTVAFSFIADITDPGKWRTTLIVLFELLFGLTITIAAFTTGYLLESFGYFYSMLLCTIVCALSFIVCITLLPETRQRRDNSTTVSIVTTVTNSWTFYFNTESKLLRTKYRLLILSFAFLALTRLNSSTLETIYQMGYPFCWSSKKISWFATTKVGATSISGILGTYVLQKYVSDGVIGVIGTSTGALSFGVEGLATSDAVMYAVSPNQSPPMQELVDTWIKCDVECPYQANDSDGEEGEQRPADGDGCKGTRQIERTVVKHSPIMPIRIYEHCLHGRLTLDRTLKGSRIVINDSNYAPAGITMHKGDHYCAIVIHNSNRLWYDGLVGALLVYCQVSKFNLAEYSFYSISQIWDWHLYSVHAIY